MDIRTIVMDGVGKARDKIEGRVGWKTKCKRLPVLTVKIRIKKID